MLNEAVICFACNLGFLMLQISMLVVDLYQLCSTWELAQLGKHS